MTSRVDKTGKLVQWICNLFNTGLLSDTIGLMRDGMIVCCIDDDVV
jgi:hypothetical protein